MSDYHQLLRRQIRKYLDGEEKQPSPEALRRLLAAVDASYRSFDRDKELSQRMFDVADAEYQEINARLLREKQIREEGIRKLMDSVRALRAEEGTSKEDDTDLDLLSVAKLLNTEVIRRKQTEDALKEAMAETEKAARVKTEFLSIMSHEIRSPLNAIIGISHVLKTEPHLSEQEENIKILEISSRNLMLLLNDILDFNKIESGKIELEKHPFDLRQLLTNIRKANDFNARDRGNEIKLFLDDALPPSVLGDSTRLGQVVTNLVSNAIKFTKGGMIRIEASMVSQSEASLRLEIAVEDQGIGIPADKQKRIFDPFTQAGPDTNRNYGGTGLGLAITKRLLNLMGSSIRLSSEEGRGSRFYFRLDLGLCDAPTQVEDLFKDEVKDLHQAHILAVDDLEFNLLTLEKIVSRWNAKVSRAVNGLEAVEKARHQAYDLILMDLQMPVMDGREATEKIRDFDLDVPIIALTASTNEETRREVLALGMNDFSGKPFEPDRLYETIKRQLKKVSS